MDGTTSSLRLQQTLPMSWQLTVHAMTQRLRNDDRTAFPYGVYTPDYACPAWCDRYAPDGSFSFWEYVSDNERRTSEAAELTVSGRIVLGPVHHRPEPVCS